MERHLIKWGYSHIIDDALLVMVELLTNAVRATPGKMIKLWCRWEADAITVEVWDSSPEPPAPAPMAEPSLDDLDVSKAAPMPAADWGCTSPGLFDQRKLAHHRTCVRE